MAFEGARIRKGIVQIIKDHNGRPCPSNARLAELLNSDPRRISEFIHLLVHDGILEKYGRQQRRVFRVVATGEKTTPRYDKPIEKLPKHCAENLAREFHIETPNLPDSVWYGGRDKNGRPFT